MPTPIVNLVVRQGANVHINGATGNYWAPREFDDAARVIVTAGSGVRPIALINGQKYTIEGDDPTGVHRVFNLFACTFIHDQAEFKKEKAD